MLSCSLRPNLEDKCFHWWQDVAPTEDLKVPNKEATHKSSIEKVEIVIIFTTNRLIVIYRD